MSYLEAHKLLSGRDDMSGIEIALGTLIQALQADLAALRARIEALESELADVEDAA